jgi:hypothetical protein
MNISVVRFALPVVPALAKPKPLRLGTKVVNCVIAPTVGGPGSTTVGGMVVGETVRAVAVRVDVAVAVAVGTVAVAVAVGVGGVGVAELVGLFVGVLVGELVGLSVAVAVFVLLGCGGGGGLIDAKERSSMGGLFAVAKQHVEATVSLVMPEPGMVKS